MLFCFYICVSGENTLQRTQVVRIFLRICVWAFSTHAKQRLQEHTKSLKMLLAQTLGWPISGNFWHLRGNSPFRLMVKKREKNRKLPAGRNLRAQSKKSTADVVFSISNIDQTSDVKVNFGLMAVLRCVRLVSVCSRQKVGAALQTFGKN
jgi:hypothetical protein